MAMKKIKIFFLLLLLVVINVSVKGDFMPKNSIQPTPIFASVRNLADYPGISLIGLEEGSALTKSNKAFEFKTGSYSAIFKFFPVTLYAVKKKYLNRKGINKIDWENDKNVLKSNLIIDAKTFKEMVPPIAMVLLDYKITGLTNSTIAIHMTGQKNISK
jgi:hypothetical protein